MENKDLAAFAMIGDVNGNIYHQKDLTKLEYFAAQAMQGILANKNIGGDYAHIAYDAYRSAKALIDVLERVKENEAKLNQNKQP